MPETVLITGATGLIGTALAQALVEAGVTVRSLSRSAKPHPVDGVETYVWDVAAKKVDPAALAGATAIVHLAGASIADKRWTRRRKREIMESRTQSAALIAQSLAKLPNSVHTIVSASAIGYYGTPLKPMDEQSPAGKDFPARVCQAWEQAAEGMANAGGTERRLVILRIGIVLARDGGVFPQMAKPVKLGVGTWPGDGNQVLSWVHIKDLISMFAFALAHPETEGVYNAVANEPCSQKFFIRLLGRYYHRFVWGFGLPEWALKLALGERAQLLLLGSTVLSNRLVEAGFMWRYPTLYDALGELCKKRRLA